MQADQVQAGVGGCGCAAAVDAQQGALGVEQGGEVDQAGLVALAGHAVGVAGGVGGGVERGGLAAAAVEGADRVGDILGGGECRGLVGEAGAGEHGLLRLHLRGTTAAVEDRPVDRGGQARRQRAGAAEGGQRQRLPAERAAQAEGGAAGGLCLVEPGEFGGDGRFGGLHVRPLAQQVGGQALAHEVVDAGGGSGHRHAGAVAQAGAQGLGFLAEQDRQRVFALRDGGVVGGDLGARLLGAGAGLLDFQ